MKLNVLFGKRSYKNGAKLEKDIYTTKKKVQIYDKSALFINEK